MIKETIGTAVGRIGLEFHWFIHGDPKLFHEAPESLPTPVRKFWAQSNEEVAALLDPPPQSEPDLTDRFVFGKWLTAFLTIQKINQTKLLSAAQKNKYPQLVIDDCSATSTWRIRQTFPKLDQRGIRQYLDTAIMEANVILNLVNEEIAKSDDINPQTLFSNTSLILAGNRALHNLQLERLS